MQKVLIVLAMFVIFIRGAVAGELRQVTAELPPFSMSGGNTPHGAIYDVLKEAHRRLGWSFQPRFLPWTRAQAIALRDPDTEIFGVARAPEREHLYKWIALVYTTHNAFVRLGDALPASLETARQLSFVCVEMNSAMSDFLLQDGFTNLSATPSDLQCAPMLMNNHVAAWFTFDSRALYLLKAAGYQGKIVIGPSIQQVGLWLAASPKFSEQRASALRRVLAQMKDDGSYDRIIDGYQ